MRTIAIVVASAAVLVLAAPAAQAGPYWAVALGQSRIDGGTYTTMYGAAWNAGSPAEATAAAVRECRQHEVPGDVPCRAMKIGKDSCFSVIRVLFRDRYDRYHSRFFAINMNAREAQRFVNDQPGFNYSVDMSQCVGEGHSETYREYVSPTPPPSREYRDRPGGGYYPSYSEPKRPPLRRRPFGKPKAVQ